MEVLPKGEAVVDVEASSMAEDVATEAPTLAVWGQAGRPVAG